MYSSAEGNELSMVFNFHHLKVDYENGDKWTDARFDFSKLKDTLNKWQVEMQEGGGWNALFWNNHDQPRANNRFGDVENFPYETATMLAQTIHMMRGTPYIYQGEEIGMTDPDFKSIDDYKDIESHNAYKKLLESGKNEAEAFNIINKKSRDNSRTPMQWDDTENAGFTSGKPWIAVNDNYKTINTKKAMADRSSIYFYYRKLIELRKDENIISDGLYFPILKDDDKIFAYIREYEGEVLINMNNFSKDYVEVDLENILEDYDKFTYLLGNYGEKKIEKIIKLAPYESLAFIKRV